MAYDIKMIIKQTGSLFECMKGEKVRKSISIIIILVMITIVSACDNHEHDFKRSSCDQPLICTVCGEKGGEPIEHVYSEATCTEAAVCKVCGAVKGEALGHDYSEATCEEAKKCKRCGTTDGKALGHDYVEANCTEAKKCKRCNVTEDEALGHSLLEATCTEAATCERCGETQGEALGHDFMEANYQAPSTCSRCGETEGVPLLASFEEHGLVINGKYNIEMDYVTGCYENRKKTTTGKAKFVNLKIFKANAQLPLKEGYVWIQIKSEVKFDDDAAQNYGWMVGDCNEDYYTIEAHDDSIVYSKEVPEEFKDFDVYGTYKVNTLEKNMSVRNY